MSQVYVGNSSGGGGGGSITINGDTGTDTGSNFTFTAFNFSDSLGVGPTWNFNVLGSTIVLNSTDANGNTVTGGYDTGSGSPITGSNNSFYGAYTAGDVISGSSNSGFGTGSLSSIETGNNNTAVGSFSGVVTFGSGSNNCYLGVSTSCADGSNCTILGTNAGTSSDVSFSNTILIGYQAGINFGNTYGNNNIIIGNAGVSTDNNIIRIGTQGTGTAEQNKCFIAGITGATVTGSTVLCSTAGQLGTISSSIRYKKNVKNIESTEFFKLRPVSFNYEGFDGVHYGFIAEEVKDVLPELVIYNEQGQPESVKYHEMYALLLHEIQSLNKRIKWLEDNV